MPFVSVEQQWAKQPEHIAAKQQKQPEVGTAINAVRPSQQLRAAHGTAAGA